MDADVDQIKMLLAAPDTQMRVGRKLKRTLYLHGPSESAESDLCVGIVDNELLAEAIVELWNDNPGRRLNIL